MSEDDFFARIVDPSSRWVNMYLEFEDEHRPVYPTRVIDD